MILVFWMLSFKLAFSLSSFTSIKRLFSFSCFLPLEWCHLHIWGYWDFSQQSWFQLVHHPAWRFTWDIISAVMCTDLSACLRWSPHPPHVTHTPSPDRTCPSPHKAPWCHLLEVTSDLVQVTVGSLCLFWNFVKREPSGLNPPWVWLLSLQVHLGSSVRLWGLILHSGTAWTPELVHLLTCWRASGLMWTFSSKPLLGQGFHFLCVSY